MSSNNKRSATGVKKVGKSKAKAKANVKVVEQPLPVTLLSGDMKCNENT